MKPYRIKRLETTASTNDDAKRAAEAGEAEGLVIHALQQTAGRGRHGRTWQSPEGNLYCSVVLRPKNAPQSFGQYSFVAALALGHTVKAFLPDVAVTLKWPNDVLAGGKKISGILLESGEGYLIVGMGLNVLHHPEDALYPSTSLHAMGAGMPAVDAVRDALLGYLWHWYDVMRTIGFAPVRSAWIANAQKGQMSVKLPDGAVEGSFETIDEQGYLVLRLADQTERVIATGDVFFAPQGAAKE
jgi:BirA family biotin operon repressor/biotin-[acetyl-CoA-carboxylase] ligase